MTELLLAVLKGLLGKVVAEELAVAWQTLLRWLVKRSARRLNDDQERYEEQWMADLDDRKTPLRKLLFALGLLWAARVVRRESAAHRPSAQARGNDSASVDTRILKLIRVLKKVRRRATDADTFEILGEDGSIGYAKVTIQDWRERLLHQRIDHPFSIEAPQSESMMARPQFDVDSAAPRSREPPRNSDDCLSG